MFLVVGLGNPGSQYEFTKHNVGFLTVDYLADKLNIKINKLKFKGLFAKEKIENQDVVLLKPQTYMNLSGESVRDFAIFFKIPPENIIVVVDDVDLPMGKIRIRKKGSAGTHNGMKSVIYQLQSDNFIRIKVGIEKEDRKDDLADYVLKGFSKDEVPIMEESMERAAKAVLEILKKGPDVAMNKFN